MTATAALYAYFNNFMISYPATAVPDDTVFPWLTYEVITGRFGDLPAGITVNMWFRTDSESVPNQKTEELRDYIEKNDLIKCDSGYIWIKPGAPWAQSLTDDTDPFIKRRYINMTLEFLTR